MSTIEQTLGIDLGTTNTVACQNFSALSIAPCSKDEFVLPSVVAYPPSGGLIVGAKAAGRRAIDPSNTIVSAKRILGLRWSSPLVANYSERYGYRLTSDAKGRAVFRTRAGDLSPTDIGAHIVDYLTRATHVNPSRTNVVISVPASFGEERCAATAACAYAAGYARAHTVHEPVATALAYLNRSNLRYAFVYDLGGGTFDAAIIECNAYPFRVVAHVGDPYLGGDDIDAEIAAYVAEKVLELYGWDLTVDPSVYRSLIAACERAKCELSAVPEVEINVQHIDDAAPANCGSVLLSQLELQEQTLALVRRTFSLCDEVLSRAELKAQDIDAVFLAGGSTRLAGVPEYVRAYFGKRPRTDLNSMHVVGLGASLVAARTTERSVLTTATSVALSG